MIFSDFDAVLDFPIHEPPAEEEFIRAAMRWHFGDDTGSPFWLRKLPSLGFDPLTDVKSFDDLRQFPNVVDELRDVRVQDLIARGYGPKPDLVAIFESGGTTGSPKRVPFMRDWLQRLLAWMKFDLTRRGLRLGGNWLAAVPGRPHMIGGFSDHEAEMFESIKFSIDMDPRWVRKLITSGDSASADAYAAHLLSQVESILRTQDVEVLLISPPLLERVARRPDLVELVHEKITHILWGGTHMDADTRRLYMTEVFPGIPLTGAYGSTMFLGACKERMGSGPDDPCVYDGLPLTVTFRVLDPGTGDAVEFGERGQLLVDHVSKGMFLPNNLERDTALRLPVAEGHYGDAIGNILPASTFGDGDIVVGVY
ncbi:phenazine antibiotic biosynthesis protein [Amycolatopsis japonica]